VSLDSPEGVVRYQAGIAIVEIASDRKAADKRAFPPLAR